MGTLWSEFRRGMRRGKPAPLPAGLTPCRECSEPRGRARFTDRITGTKVELDIACICDGVLCGRCGRMPVRRPGSNRYDIDTAEVRHCGTWAFGLPCVECRAEVGTGEPQGPAVACYDIGASPFYAEAPGSADYFDSRRYRKFEDGLGKLVSRHGVQLLNVTRVQGVRPGEEEPSAVISVKGEAQSVRAVMAALADRWGQDGVTCVRTDPPGPVT